MVGILTALGTPIFDPGEVRKEKKEKKKREGEKEKKTGIGISPGSKNFGCPPQEGKERGGYSRTSRIMRQVMRFRVEKRKKKKKDDGEEGGGKQCPV